MIAKIDTSADVVVVGGGVVGLFTAYYLRRHHRDVTVIERGGIGSGASRGNCGYLCPSHVLPLCMPGAVRHATAGMVRGLFRGGSALSIPPRIDPNLWRWLMQFAARCRGRHMGPVAAARHRLLSDSMRLYDEFFRNHQLDEIIQRRGLWMVHRHESTADAFEKTAEQLRSEFGLKVQRFDGRSLAEREPAMRADTGGGWLFPDDVHVDPSRMMDRLTSILTKVGVRFIEHAEVENVLPHSVGSGATVRYRTSDHGPIDLSASDVVITAGAESPRFADALGGRIPIVPGKGYSMSVAMPQPAITAPMIFEDTHVAVTPLGDRLRIGSTMSLCGYDRNIDPKRIRRIRNDAASYFSTELSADITEQWTGWRPMVFDDVPCIDRSRRYKHVWVAAGNGMIGLSTAPATGRMIARRVTGQTTDGDEAFSLKRFSKF